MPEKIFRPDIFSVSKPVWTRTDTIGNLPVEDVLSVLPEEFGSLCGDPEQSGALGINSSNFRLTTQQGILLLKRWSGTSDLEEVRTTLALMSWLAAERLPVPAPLRFRSGETVHQIGSGIWSFFPFVSGDYFSGTGEQLDAAAIATCRLASALSRVPLDCTPPSGPKHLTGEDDDVLRRVGLASRDWGIIFGVEYAEVLSENWEILTAEWKRLVASPPDAGPVWPSHFDLHPHNILTTDDAVTAILDFEACKLMPMGYAIAFAALKQCRQAVALREMSGLAASIGARYLARLDECSPETARIADRIGDLAVCEAVRRICLILRLNIDKGVNTWNRVLPIQLGHLSEARALFGS